MKAPVLELGDIFRLHGPAYLTTFGDLLSHEQKKALRAITVCRTAALGGHLDQCDQCGYRKISYCSCRNRHCPKCHGQARARWLEQRAAELLPGRILPCGLHLAAIDRAASAAEPAISLWPSLPCRRRNLVANRRRPK